MISIEKARELTEKAKQKKLEEFKAILEEAKFSEEIERRANMGYHSAEMEVPSRYLTEATEYFNSFGYAVCRTPHSPYSNMYTMLVSW